MNFRDLSSEDFRALDDVAFEIGNYLRRYGRVQVQQTKEKWGEVRVYCHFGWSSLHDIFYPGYAYVQKPWLTRISLRWIPIERYQQYLYRRAYRKAVEKYPRLRDNILDGADWNEYLEGL